jgi:Tfp pilus assembly protein PilX
MSSANKKNVLCSQQGVALVTAILACVILFALAMLVLHLSTSDLRVSSKTVGQKKALNAAEAGIHRLIQDFDPNTATWDPADTDSIYGKKTNVDADNDSASFYTISAPDRPSSKIYCLPVAGYDMSGGKDWGLANYQVIVTGRNDNYATEISIEAGIGFGPVKRDTVLE